MSGITIETLSKDPLIEQALATLEFLMVTPSTEKKQLDQVTTVFAQLHQRWLALSKQGPDQQAEEEDEDMPPLCFPSFVASVLSQSHVDSIISTLYDGLVAEVMISTKPQHTSRFKTAANSMDMTHGQLVFWLGPTICNSSNSLATISSLCNSPSKATFSPRTIISAIYAQFTIRSRKQAHVAQTELQAKDVIAAAKALRDGETFTLVYWPSASDEDEDEGDEPEASRCADDNDDTSIGTPPTLHVGPTAAPTQTNTTLGPPPVLRLPLEPTTTSSTLGPPPSLHLDLDTLALYPNRGFQQAPNASVTAALPPAASHSKQTTPGLTAMDREWIDSAIKMATLSLPADAPTSRRLAMKAAKLNARIILQGYADQGHNIPEIESDDD
ncbi:hypothetical protein K4K55_011330 [Colletotrichum sp. SAR 10_96]|nr:hypothetical protein K4K55_011330 [Colletotrichum sp. SAR 10_96]